MLFPSLPLDSSSWTLLRLSVHDAHVAIFLQSTAKSACCPLCQQPATRVHSRYIRRLADLPWQDRAVRLQVEVRRFFCSAPDCPRRIFAERLASLALPFARTTLRLRQTHSAIGFAMGGEAGARLAERLAMQTSPDTLLRRIRQTPLPEWPVPRVLGVDDWAWRKGTRYGTILCDLEARRPVDLLPNREADTLAQWLKAHPGVQVISRDRAGAYAAGARDGAPTAVQVADRFHLLCNVREALERLLDRKQVQLRAAAQPRPAAPAEVPYVPTVVAPDRPSTSAARRQQARRERRLARFTQVRQLGEQGAGIREIARLLHLGRGTVRRYLRAEAFPERLARRPMPRRLASQAEFLRLRWEAGCHNVAQLHRELRAAGHRCSYATVQRQIERLGWTRDQPRRDARASRRVAAVPVPSGRRVSFWLMKPAVQRENDQQMLIDRLCAADREIAAAVGLAAEFATLLRERRVKGLPDWLVRAETAAALEMRGLAGSLRQDEAAVTAALREPWSNGPVEGQVNRLKLIKRQMFGRAKFDLLRRRVLAAG